MSYRHPDLDRLALSLRQLTALEAMIRAAVPADSQLMELEVLPSSPGNPAPLEVRAVIAEPVGGTVARSWSQALVEEVRRGWAPTDFQFTIHRVEGAPDPDVPPGLIG